MNISADICELKLRYPFRTARKVTTDARTVLIRIEHEGYVGLGEASPSVYYHGETPEKVVEATRRAMSIIGEDPFKLETVMDELAAALPDCPAALAGLDIALHDLCGKMLGVPLYKFFGLDPRTTPRTSYTIGLDTIDVMLRKLSEARDYSILKIKVGVEGDLDMLKAIRDNTDAAIRVDANTGWETDEAIDRINQMAQYDIEFVEQPIAPGNYDGLRKIRENTDIPIMADEDCVNCASLPPLAGCVDAINIKLMKCSGLREAHRMIHVAHALDMKVMLGCMSESSLSLTAAAHLSPLVEYADLDSDLLITNDPFSGLALDDAKIVLPDRAGVGAIPAES